MSADSGALPVEAPQRSFGQFALRFRVSGVLAFLVLLGVVFALLSPQFLTPENLSAIVSNAAILTIVAAAQAVVLITRNLDVSVGSIMGFAAYLTADFAARNHGVGGVLVLMPLVIGGALGADQRAARRLRPGLAADRDARHDVALSRPHLHLRPRPGGHLQQAAALDDRTRSTCGSAASRCSC